MVQKARQGGIDIYFVGDSITRRWGAADPQYRPLLENWKSNFFGWNAGNFGWGADRAENILWRLENGELDGVNPKVIVVLAGSNNVGKEAGDARKVEDITQGLRAILGVCQAKAPNATVILTAIFPRNDNMGAIPTINQINRNIARMAGGKKVRYININDKLADKDGGLLPRDDESRPASSDPESLSNLGRRPETDIDRDARTSRQDRPRATADGRSKCEREQKTPSCSLAGNSKFQIPNSQKIPKSKIRIKKTNERPPENFPDSRGGGAGP